MQSEALARNNQMAFLVEVMNIINFRGGVGTPPTHTHTHPGYGPVYYLEFYSNSLVLLDFKEGNSQSRAYENGRVQIE